MFVSYKYSKFCSGQKQEFLEGDIFRIIVPLDEEYSFDYDLDIIADGKTDGKTNGKADGKSMQPLTDTERKVLDLVKDTPAITQKQLAYSLNLSDSRIRYVMRRLKEKGLIRRIGSHRSGGWQLN